jgi:ATP-binding cassette, subfamily B, multidrug efflux pump
VTNGQRRRRSISFAELGRSLGYLRPHAGTVAGASLSVLAAAGLTLVAPQFIRLLIDRGISGGDWRWVVISAGALFGVALVRGIFSFFQGYLAEKVSQSLAFDLRNDLFDKLHRLSFGYHDRAQTGQLMTRMTSDVENVRQFAGMGLLNAGSALVTMLGTLVLLLVLEPRLAAVTFASVVLIFCVFWLLVTRIFPLHTGMQQWWGNILAILQENLAGVAVVKAFGREGYERGRYENANDELYGQALRVLWSMSATMPSIFLAGNLGNLAVVWYGGSLVIAGKMTIGDLVAFTTYLAFMLTQIYPLGMVGGLMGRAGASAVRVFEVLDAESEVSDRAGAGELERVAGRLTFDHVSFRYAGQREDVLDDACVEILPGQRVALVGSTGSGKSTMVNLVPRFYDVAQGAVKIDGVDVRDVTLASLRSHIGIVLQESTLFGGTIRENIAFGRPAAADDEIIAAARAAQAHEFIAALPNGYDTSVGERGVTLSGGQRQRLSIARTLLLDPAILLLDDATSSVDAATEYSLHRALEKLMVTRTSLVIAHRLSSVIRADRILVLDGGKIVADGRHDDLLRDSPLYGEIVDSQLEPEVVAPLAGRPAPAGGEAAP